MIQQFIQGNVVNLTPDTVQLIEEARLPVACFWGAEGYWIRVLTSHKQDNSTYKSPDLLTLVAHAREHGCTWIYLDSESDPIPHLPDYKQEWDTIIYSDIIP